MLSFKNIACRRGAERLFGDLNATIYRGQKAGITGANGSGKSSLFGMVLGDIEVDEGEIDIQQGIEVVHVAQETRSSPLSALDFVVDGDKRLRQVEQALDALKVELDGMAADEDSPQAKRYGELLGEYESAGAYTAKARAGALLNGLGFTPEQHDKPVSEFSGGWRMRLNLAQALMAPGDLLLLDEPTNHLDLNAVIWLEQWLQSYNGTLLLISHDREFLDNTVQFILHIEHGTGTLYTGNYSRFEVLRAEQLAFEQASFQRQQKKIKAMEAFVTRFKAKASKAKQAQSRLKMLERMTLSAPLQATSGLDFEFPSPEHLPDPLIRLDDADIGYSSATILAEVQWSLQCGDRIGLLGRNGAGKSTLLKSLRGELPVLSGRRQASGNLRIGYFAQHQVDQLQPGSSPVQHLMDTDPTVSDQRARDYVGGFGFHGDQALRDVSTLSGGEKARLALSLLIWQKPNLLLLDEPTNHLDLPMRQALATALQGYQGALIVISHDRFLLNAVADHFLLVDAGKLQPFDDDLLGYSKWLAETADAKASAPATSSSQDTYQPGSSADRKQRKQREAQRRQQLQPLRGRVEKAERETGQIRQKLEELRTRLADNQLYSNDQKSILAELLREESQLKTAFQQAEEEWLDAMEMLERAETDGNQT